MTTLVEVYRLGEEVEILNNPETVAGDPVLSGFELDLSQVFAHI